MSEETPPGVARLPSRAELRELVARQNAEQRQVIRAGGNPYQAGLDQNDKINAYAALLSPEARLAFLTMYTEEVNASAKQIETDTAAMVTRAARSNAQAGTLATVIVFAVLFFSFRACY